MPLPLFTQEHFWDHIEHHDGTSDYISLCGKSEDEVIAADGKTWCYIKNWQVVCKDAHRNICLECKQATPLYLLSKLDI